MADIAEVAAELAGIWPALAAALARDTAGTAGAGTATSAATVVNADVLHATITLTRQIPDTTRYACDTISEPWRLRRRGLDFRVSHGKGSDGRDVYTIPGSGMEYRVPSADEFMAASGMLPAPFNGGTTDPPNGAPVTPPTWPGCPCHDPVVFGHLCHAIRPWPKWAAVTPIPIAPLTPTPARRAEAAARTPGWSGWRRPPWRTP